MPTSPHSHEAPTDDLLPSDPPRTVIRAIAWLIVAIFSTGLAAAIIIHIPETVSCPFILVSRHGADPVQAPLDGVLECILVTEGQAVVAGQKLFTLRSDQVRGWQTCGRIFGCSKRNRSSVVKPTKLNWDTMTPNAPRSSRRSPSGASLRRPAATSSADSSA
jgi:hypothetical protein